MITEPIEVICCEDTGRIDETIRKLFAIETKVAPDPLSWSGLLKPLIKAAKVRSEAKFMDGTKCVLLSLRGEKLTLTPTTSSRMGRSIGFKPITDKVRTVKYSTADISKELFDSLINSTVSHWW